MSTPRSLAPEPSDATLLVGLGIALPRARRALERAGSLPALLAVPRSAFFERTGLSRRAHDRLHAARELGRRVLSASLPRGHRLSTPAEARHYALALTRDLPYETFHAIWLTSRHRVLCTEELARGTLHEAPVYPREVLRRAIDTNADAVIFLHNHPGGDPNPSGADRRLTARLVHVLSLVDTRVVDHLIAADGFVLSFRDAGLL